MVSDDQIVVKEIVFVYHGLDYMFPSTYCCLFSFSWRTQKISALIRTLMYYVALTTQRLLYRYPKL